MPGKSEKRRHWRALQLKAHVGALIAVLALVTAATANAQRLPSGRRDSVPASRGRLLGVYDEESGAPVVGALVSDVLTGDHTLTSATGTVSLWFVREKGSLVQVRKIGYEPWQSIVDPIDTTPITVTLKRAVELPLVQTSARPNISNDPGERDGFDLRCQATNVACVREDVINAHPSNTLGDILMKLPGIVPGRGLQMRGNSSGYCRPTYYVDGTEWTQGVPIDLPGEAPGGSPRGSRQPAPPFNTSNVEKVEVYPSYSVRPMRFSGNANCGVIAIWTK